MADENVYFVPSSIPVTIDKRNEDTGRNEKVRGRMPMRTRDVIRQFEMRSANGPLTVKAFGSGAISVALTALDVLVRNEVKVDMKKVKLSRAQNRKGTFENWLLSAELPADIHLN